MPTRALCLSVAYVYPGQVRYVMPSVPIDPRAQQIHGISIELLVERQAQSLAVVLTPQHRNAQREYLKINQLN